tara:strand:+ start:607 stop:978 length:372 start_codon:yes stop_codon:yes gene_type:complete
MTKKKKENIEKEEIKVVDEVIIEETPIVEEVEVENDAEEVVEEVEVENDAEEVVEEVEEVVEEVVEETIKFEDTEAGKLAVEAIRKAKEGKVVKLTQKTAEFEDGTIVRFNGRATHREYKAKM